MRKLGKILVVMVIGFMFLLGVSVCSAKEKKDGKNEVKIFDGELKDGWKVSNWSALGTKIEDGAIKTIVSEKTIPWMTFYIGCIDKADAVDIKGKDGYLKFLINGNEDNTGTHIGAQELQINLSFVEIEDDGTSGFKMDGKRIKSSSAYKPLSAYISGEVIDDNPDTWQDVKVPLSLFSDIKAIEYIFFQYIKDPPKAGVQVKDIKIVF